MSARPRHPKSLEATLRAQVHGRSYRAVPARLPFEWRASHAAPVFSFGVPFPWEPSPSDQLLSTEEPVVALHAPRSDRTEASFALWVDLDGDEVETSDITPLIRKLEDQAETLPWDPQGQSRRRRLPHRRG